MGDEDLGGEREKVEGSGQRKKGAERGGRVLLSRLKQSRAGLIRASERTSVKMESLDDNKDLLLHFTSFAA
jgi:hypothetical protein